MPTVGASNTNIWCINLLNIFQCQNKTIIIIIFQHLFAGSDLIDIIHIWHRIVCVLQVLTYLILIITKISGSTSKRLIKFPKVQNQFVSELKLNTMHHNFRASTLKY